MTALGGLDGFAGLCGTARGRFGVFAFGVGGGGGEGGGCEADGQGDGEDVGGDLHICWFGLNQRFKKLIMSDLKRKSETCLLVMFVC